MGIFCFVWKLIASNKYQIILWLLICSYIAYFSTFSILRYRHLYAEYYDLGIMNQTVYNTYQAIKTGDLSRVLALTSPGGIEQITRIAIHNDIILAFLAPLYFLYSGPETLLLLQTLILAIGAWAVYKIAQLKLKYDFLALAFAFAYLMYSPMQRANIFEFHAVTFATTFILFMFYFWMKGKLRLSLLFLILTLLTKEETGLTVGMFGIYIGFQQVMKRQTLKSLFFPLTVTLLSWGWSLLSVYLIIPVFRGNPHFAIGYYNTVFSNIGKDIFSWDTLSYFFFLLGPLSFLTIFAPEFIGIATPELGINLLSNNLQLRSLIFQYASVIQPWLFIGAIYGAGRIAHGNKSRSIFVAIVLVLLTSVFSYFKSPLPYSREKNVDALLYDRNDEYQVVKKWAERLASDNIKVSSTDQIAPFFTSRRYFYIFSHNYIYADYVIVSVANIHFTYRNDVTIPAYEELKNDTHFEKIDDENGYEVYKRI